MVNGRADPRLTIDRGSRGMGGGSSRKLARGGTREEEEEEEGGVRARTGMRRYTFAEMRRRNGLVNGSIEAETFRAAHTRVSIVALNRRYRHDLAATHDRAIFDLRCKGHTCPGH